MKEKEEKTPPKRMGGGGEKIQDNVTMPSSAYLPLSIRQRRSNPPPLRRSKPHPAHMLRVPIQKIPQVMRQIEPHRHDILVALDVVADHQVHHGALRQALDAVDRRPARRVDRQVGVVALSAKGG